MIADYHVHTPYCGHAHGKIIQYVEAAVALGLDEIGFADHLGRYYLTRSQKKRYWDWGMDERDLGRYTSELLDLREAYADRITIKIGLEVDYIEGAEELAHSFTDHFPLDFLLCSIHCLPSIGWKHIANYNTGDTAPIYKEYFHAARMALRSGAFNSLAHLDFIWRYLAWPETGERWIFDEIESTVAAAAECNGIIEINANGFLWSRVNKIAGGDPFSVLLNAVKNYNVGISIGSDAHDPKMVGKTFDELIPVLHHSGISSFTTFSECKAVSSVLG